MRRSGNCLLKCFQVGVRSGALCALLAFTPTEKGPPKVRRTRREKSMVRKSRKSASQWETGMPMVPLKPRESGDTGCMAGILTLCIFICQGHTDFPHVHLTN